MDYDRASKQISWHCKKFELTFNTDPPKFKIYYNCIYWVHLGYNVGSEQNKLRPAIITRYNKNSNLCTVIPITSKHRGDKYPYHIDLECMPCVALVEQMRVVDIRRINNPERSKGRTLSITPNDWKSVQEQIIALYHLKPLPTQPMSTKLNSVIQPVSSDNSEKQKTTTDNKQSEKNSETLLTKV